MAFKLVVFDQRVLSGNERTKTVLRMIAECKVSKAVIHPTTGVPDFIRDYASQGYVGELWPSQDNDENLLSAMIAHHRTSPQDTLCVCHNPRQVSAAKKLGIRSVCFASDYHAPAYLKEVMPDVIIKDIWETLNIIRAQIPS
jgi:hypothetical protein